MNAIPKRCYCPCHGDVNSAYVGARGVEVTDPLHAVVACSACQNAHTPALSDAPDTHGPSTPPTFDATAWTPDEGEE